jgi:ribosomal peptide maturation radical SAM protein 1
MRVLLASMPWGAVDRPALGISLLKAGLASRGVPCDVRYLNLTFAAFLGLDGYNWVQGGLPHVAFAGDWLFAEALYGPQPADDARYLDKILGERWGVPPAARADLLAMRSRIEPFLEHCLAAVDWRAYSLVGFTSTFEQNIASLALARRLKAAHPELRTAFGGANWEGEMGEELHRCFPFIDLACSGEADESFPAVVQALAGARSLEALSDIPGVIWRDTHGRTVANGPAAPITVMDALPIPDFADYFRELEASGTASAVVPTLLFETSRGCWWGAKSHCTFCGLNGGAMAFRSKSAARALDELRTLVTTWRTGFVAVVDNILDMRYFRDFLPALEEVDLGVELFYEVKANLSKSQVELLARAGVRRIQPGIESLSDHVLRLMRKGTTALRNIQLLKWCRQSGIAVDWNILYGFPGETTDDYERMSAMLPAIRSLGPPGAFGPIRLDRFSPYFTTPDRFGLTGVRPMGAYEHLYPFAPSSIARIAYYFDFDYAPGAWPGDVARPFLYEVQDWIAYPDLGSLVAVDCDDGTLLLLDQRRDALAHEHQLDAVEREAYLYCDEIRSAEGVTGHLRRLWPDRQIENGDVVGMLDRLVADRLMLREGSLYLSLALMAPAAVAPTLQLAA